MAWCGAGEWLVVVGRGWSWLVVRVVVEQLCSHCFSHWFDFLFDFLL